MQQSGADFNAIRISLASPEQIRAWSYGEVTKPETINYRTLRPEKDGLFCERIFGPTKDWECYCGKYKKIRYKGVICDRCGVEVARSKVRRERMGHIKLAAPIAHIWFSKGTPSRLGLLLDLSPRNLERILYFAQYIVIEVDEEARNQARESLVNYRDGEVLRLTQELEDGPLNIQTESVESAETAKSGETEEDGQSEAVDPEVERQDALAEFRRQKEEQIAEIENTIEAKITELDAITPMDLLTEARYRELRDQFGESFRAGMGAESVLEILKKVSLDDLRDDLADQVKNTSGQRRKKAIKRLQVVEAFRKSGNKQEWMILTMLPVLPPELHPMVQLDGGRFATSDLNDLYRRVINRNNRLKHLMDLQAPDIIVRNEKRMLQEAVDALIDNGRRGRAIQGSHNHKLKSLTDLLRGKQGRFRQNLLGKRVDYSGRSVIIAGPELKMHECGLPKRMALELFKPFVMNALVVKGYAHNIKSAKRMAERARPEIWDILEEVIQNHPVLLNRAPTLHRLGIQAFQPVLVEGSAIQIHPLVCAAFNADFDGDQMAVHVPLSREAVLEAQRIMLSTFNMLAPSSGDPIVAPTLDMVLGVYYLTGMDDIPDGFEAARFADFDDARLAHEVGLVSLREPVRIKDDSTDSGWLDTTVGRIVLNQALPDDLSFINTTVDRGDVKDLVSECFARFGHERTAQVLDNLKDLGFHYATRSGTTIAINDVITPPQKQSLLSAADSKIARLEDQYLAGLITAEERYQAAVDIWTGVSDKMTVAVEDMLPNYGGIYAMADSGAKGNLAQIKQMAGMRGLMSDPKGRIIELPIRSSFAEGLSVMEYFISTHGARKGLADTALRTADSGYLTRRLADVAQDVIILTEDCGTRSGLEVDMPRDQLDTTVEHSILSRFPSEPIVDPKTGEVIADLGQPIDADIAKAVEDAGLTSLWIRSPITCEAPRGLCQKCYGVTLATGDEALNGEAVGIIAAQSIGEPGTQLTMRTFHTGGIASAADITHGLPRVIELFEARAPRGQAILSEIAGEAELVELPEGRVIKIVSTEEFQEDLDIPSTHKQLIKTGDWVNTGQPIIGVKKTVQTKAARQGIVLAHPDEISAPVAGTVKVARGRVSIMWTEEDEREYLIPAASNILVEDGQEVLPGQALTAGPKNPHEMLRIEGQAAVQRYMVNEVQAVYRSQGVSIHDKHIETIIRQMMRKVRVEAPGDTELLPGDLVHRHEYERVNNQTLTDGGEPATASSVLLGVTRASLNTDSFLAAASFQETAKVLTGAAVNGSVDRLMGLKENVIIGRLIPARLDTSGEGREKLGIGELGDRAAGQLTGFTQAPATFEEALAAIGGAELVGAGVGSGRLQAGVGNGARTPMSFDAPGPDLGVPRAAASALIGQNQPSTADSADEEARLAAEALVGSTSGDGTAAMEGSQTPPPAESTDGADPESK